jgi:hypothetical protein
MQKHLVGAIDILSPFSSWTPSLMAAYLFAGSANDDTGRIAVIDTTLIQNELYCVDHYSLRGPPAKRVHNRLAQVLSFYSSPSVMIFNIPRYITLGAEEGD